MSLKASKSNHTEKLSNKVFLTAANDNNGIQNRLIRYTLYKGIKSAFVNTFLKRFCLLFGTEFGHGVNIHFE